MKQNNEEEKHRLVQLAEYLQAQYLQFNVRQGRVYSMSEFAKYLGVSPMSLSQWMNGYRAPTGKNLHQLAAALGPEIYTIVGEPPHMPDDPAFALLARLWYKSDDQAKQEVMKILEEAEKRRRKSNPGEAEGVA